MQIKLTLQYHDKVVAETEDGYVPNNYTEKQRNEIAEKFAGIIQASVYLPYPLFGAVSCH